MAVEAPGLDLVVEQALDLALVQAQDPVLAQGQELESVPVDQQDLFCIYDPYALCGALGKMTFYLYRVPAYAPCAWLAQAVSMICHHRGHEQKRLFE